jgi:hypothetical protein
MSRNRGENEMTKRIAGLTSMILLALGIAAFTGSAFAGNGNGNGNANGQNKDTAAAPTAAATQQPISQAAAGNSADTHGNSANAPGQAKKDSASAQASGGGSADQNAGAQAGVKPTSATAKGNKPTSCSTGGGTGSSATCTSSGSNAATAQTAAKADASKRYGNGKTAAQIANSRGAPAGTHVYGPGNSQPHKVWDCRRQHWVDVHAVKSYSSASCVAQASRPTVSETRGTTGTTSNSSHTSNTSNAVSTASNTSNTRGSALGATATGSGPAAQGGTTRAGGVLGVTASGGNSQPAGGVLGAVESVGSGVLPFTGFPLWIVVIAALGLIVLGLTLRRQGRVTV